MTSMVTFKDREKLDRDFRLLCPNSVNLFEVCLVLRYFPRDTQRHLVSYVKKYGPEACRSFNNFVPKECIEESLKYSSLLCAILCPENELMALDWIILGKPIDRIEMIRPYEVFPKIVPELLEVIKKESSVKEYIVSVFPDILYYLGEDVIVLISAGVSVNFVKKRLPFFWSRRKDIRATILNCPGNLDYLSLIKMTPEEKKTIGRRLLDCKEIVGSISLLPDIFSGMPNLDDIIIYFFYKTNSLDKKCIKALSLERLINIYKEVHTFQADEECLEELMNILGKSGLHPARIS